ncbi:MAG: hypothetical protein WC606_00980 [Candidatus Absconditabacterales bacterium]
MTKVLIPDPLHVQDSIAHFVADGKEHFHVVADFDRTLTKAFVDGKPRLSLESILEQEGYLGPEYTEKSKINFDKYYPIEQDPTIPLEEKKKAMHEWRTRQFAVMLEAGLTRNIIKKAMTSKMIIFRLGYEIFFDLLKNNNVPLLIFSASGLGYEAIYYCLENKNKLSDNIDIISNAFVRDEDGKAIAIKEPIIHSFNKGETVVKDSPIYEEIKERKNILLLGDSLGDVRMADGFDYENILKIGFLNNDTPENREQFQKKFDILILNDGPMDEVNEILKQIMKSE